MKMGFQVFLALLLAFGSFTVSARASETGSFLSIRGNVQLNGSSAQAGSNLKAGDEVVTGKDGEATLKFFDGSQITLKAGSDLRVDRLEKPGPADKILQFKMLLGHLMADVKKLASASSSFEIESGGVVCGVRGTEFSLDYDSVQDRMKLHVFSGTVGTKAHGQEALYNAGETAIFIQGAPRDQATGHTTGKRIYGSFHMEGSLSLDPALKDLKTFYGQQLLLMHNMVFADPAVGGTQFFPAGAVIPPGEAVP